MSAETSPVSHQPSAGLVSRSHLGIEPFSLRRPVSLADAAAMVAAGDWAHAGGIDVAQRLRSGEAPEALVPLCRPGAPAANGLELLHEISVRGEVLFIGAAVTHTRIETDELVQAHRRDLAEAWRTLGNVRIRSTGTLGGNLMAFNSGYDAAPILAAAGAELIFALPDGTEQRCSVEDRPHGLLLVGCEVPLNGCVVYDRSSKPAASVAVGDRFVAVGCAYPDVAVLPIGTFDTDGLRAALSDLPMPTDDAFASAAYRRRIIEVLTERCAHEHRRGTRGTSRTGTDVNGAAGTHSAASSESALVAGHPLETTEPGTRGDVEIALRLNGVPFTTAAPPSEMLVDTIRSRAGLGGTRIGCDQAVCGACTVLMDGSPTASCSTFSWQAEGREILTIESGQHPQAGEPSGEFADVLPTVQQHFAAASAFQCGYCTPGLILTASALLARHRNPDRSTICDWLDSNVCRCTGYLMVIEAVEAAATALRNSDPAVSSPEPDPQQ